MLNFIINLADYTEIYFITIKYITKKDWLNLIKDYKQI